MKKIFCRVFILALIACGLSASPTLSQDLSSTVLPITGFKLKLKKSSIPSLVPKIVPAIEEDFGTGFCIDLECRLIGTNYHVAANARPRKIKGQEVIQRYLATGPDDEEATLNHYLSERPLKFKLNRDLAIFELRHPIPHYHGIAFSLDDLELDQQVDIYAYPVGANYGHAGANPIRSLVQFPAAFKGVTTAGLLAFEYEGKQIRGGASGGLVVDRKTHQSVGVLTLRVERTFPTRCCERRSAKKDAGQGEWTDIAWLDDGWLFQFKQCWLVEQIGAVCFHGVTTQFFTTYRATGGVSS